MGRIAKIEVNKIAIKDEVIDKLTDELGELLGISLSVIRRKLELMVESGDKGLMKEKPSQLAGLLMTLMNAFLSLASGRSKKLTLEEIKEMKEEVEDSEELIEKLIERINNRIEEDKRKLLKVVEEGEKIGKTLMIEGSKKGSMRVKVEMPLNSLQRNYLIRKGIMDEEGYWTGYEDYRVPEFARRFIEKAKEKMMAERNNEREL
ncbi:MAG: hypothetical protein QXJ06_00545 [Candidatus Aenigmatarchaeota archaeon]